MKQLVIILLLFSCLKVSAQVKPIYFIGDRITDNKDKATSYAIYGKLSTEDVWLLKRYDLDDNLMQTGSYTDASLTMPHGKFVFYANLETFNALNKENYKLKGKTRYISNEGYFLNGKQEGKWFTFYPDGNVFNVEEYKQGILHGEYKTYDKFGNIIVEGHYVNGEKDGEWLTEKGEIKEIYKGGLLKSRTYIQKKKKKTS